MGDGYTIRPPRSPFGITPGGRPPASVIGATEAWKRQSQKAEEDWKRRQAGATQPQEPEPLVSHEQQKATDRAATEAAAKAARDTRKPEDQPDNVPVTESTNSGASGPRTPTAMEITRPYGTMTVHRAPGAKDPALEPGGFAAPGAPAAGGTRADMERINMLPEHGRAIYGPQGATGGHEWTIMKPGRQRAAYEAARYRREVQGRQAAEDAAIYGREAEAARSRALSEEPFEPEYAAIAAEVGGERAKAQPRIRQQEMVADLFSSFQENRAKIQADNTKTPEQKAQAIEEERQMFYMALAGLAGRDVTPREPMFGAALPPDEEA